MELISWMSALSNIRLHFLKSVFYNLHPSSKDFWHFQFLNFFSKGKMLQIFVNEISNIRKRHWWNIYVMILTECDWNSQFFCILYIFFVLVVLYSYWFNFIEPTSLKSYTNIQDMKRFHRTGAVAETDVFCSYDKLLYGMRRYYKQQTV